MLVASGWNYFAGSALLPAEIEYGSLFVFILLALVVLLVESVPGLLLVPVALAAWTLSLPHWALWQQMIAYSLLCVLIFASRFIWNVLPARTRRVPATLPHDLLALGGQALVVLFIIAQGGFFAEAGLLAHVGAGALFVLAGLLFFYGHLQMSRPVQHWCTYVAGLLISLVVSWELSVFHQTHIDILILVPASYLIVISPFLSQDKTLLHHQRAGQLASIAGSALLLLPTLWLSFGESNLQPTLLLAAEALVLLFLGIVTRIRVFVLSGAGIVVVSAIHALFLPSLGIPPFLALAIT